MSFFFRFIKSSLLLILGYYTFMIRQRFASDEVSQERPIYDGMFFSDGNDYVEC